MVRKRPEIYTVPARGTRPSKGFYVARKRSWAPTASFVIVMVTWDYANELLHVFEPGDPNPSPLGEWIIRDRILGLAEATAHYAASLLGKTF